MSQMLYIVCIIASEKRVERIAERVGYRPHLYFYNLSDDVDAWFGFSTWEEAQSFIEWCEDNITGFPENVQPTPYEAGYVRAGRIHQAQRLHR